MKSVIRKVINLEGAKRINIWVNEEVLQEFTKVARSKGMNRTSVINFLITEYLHKERLKQNAEEEVAKKAKKK